MTYGVISDLHLHGWSAFSRVEPDGTNSRLRILLGEIERAAAEVRAAGGETLIVAGDVFHVRGSVAPSVLNPTLDLFRKLVMQEGMKIYILSGNHDLEGKHSSRLGSAITALEGVGCRTISEVPSLIDPEPMSTSGVGLVCLFPWEEDLDKLKKSIEKVQGKTRHIIIHAPVNGVLQGLPQNGLDPAWLETLDFDVILSGHYHNHKQVARNAWSIGALAHHTWSDVGSKAGFVLVNGSDVRYRATHAPEFRDLDASMDDDDMRFAAVGAYVRVRVKQTTLEETEQIRQVLMDAGALGVIVLAEPKVVNGDRPQAIVSGPTVTLAQSVAAYTRSRAWDQVDPAALEKRCDGILLQATTTGVRR